MATIALPRFLEKLRNITDTTPPDIACWSEDGMQYEVQNTRFETEVLTRHFDAKRSLLSFVRQLNYYGFKKLENKGTMWAISHPKFQRDAPHLIYEIKRKTRKEHIVTASKEEVQSIRTEVGIMKANMMNEIEGLRSQIYFLQTQLSQYISTTSNPLPHGMMRYPEFDNQSVFPVEANGRGQVSHRKRSSKLEGTSGHKKRRRRRDEGADNETNGSLFAKMLPHTAGRR